MTDLSESDENENPVESGSQKTVEKEQKSSRPAFGDHFTAPMSIFERLRRFTMVSRFCEKSMKRYVVMEMDDRGYHKFYSNKNLSLTLVRQLESKNKVKVYCRNPHYGSAKASSKLHSPGSGVRSSRESTPFRSITGDSI